MSATAGETILAVQELLGVPEKERARRVGPKTRAALDRLAAVPPTFPWPAAGAPVLTVPEGRQISADGLMLVKEFEGLYLEAYRDEAGIWTIGWGHTGLQHNDGTVYAGRLITVEKAEELLQYDMNQFERRVETLIKVPLTQDQFDALVAFDFNTGGLTLPTGQPSTLRLKLNRGDYEGAASEFPKWNKVDGVAIAGLTRRRASERNLFEGKRPFIVPYRKPGGKTEQHDQ